MIVALVGPPGCGKTYIARLLESSLDYAYTEYEKEMLERYGSREGFLEHKSEALGEFEEQLRSRAESSATLVVLETTGLSDRPMIDRLSQDFSLVLVKVLAPKGVCVERIRSREPNRNFSNDVEGAAEFYDYWVDEVAPSYSFDLEVDNVVEGARDVVRAIEDRVGELVRSESEQLHRSDLIEPASKRLRLRQWRDSDYEPFANLNADPTVMEFFAEPLTRDQSDASAHRIRAHIAENGWGLWAVEVDGGAPFIGFVGLARVDASVPVGPCVEIGWRLAASYWDKGYATEAATAALRAGFEFIGIEEIVSFTSSINVRSRRVMERIGMVFAGETFEHPKLSEGNPLRTHVVYRLSRDSHQGSA